MPQTLSREQLEELRQFDTPAVSNAIELFGVRPFNTGFMGPEIKCILPVEKPIIGYACTAKIAARTPATPEQKELRMQYYEKIKAAPEPAIAVLQDLDPVPAGSFWGEVTATIHKSLGCAATITNGGVRDVNEMKQLGFACFATCLLVSHAYIHVEAIDSPVEIGGLTVHPGDLLHADQHGVLLIPREIAPELAEACRQSIAAELPVINGCKNKGYQGVELAELKLWMAEMARQQRRK